MESFTYSWTNRFKFAKSEMGSAQLLYFVSLTILIHSSYYQVTAQSLTYRYHYCQGANYTSNSTFQENLNLLLPPLSSNITQSNKFFNNSIGQNPDRVYGILLCRGDLTDEACKTCSDTAIGEVTTRCPNKKEYISWYDECMLRYSNKNIFSVMQIEPSRPFHNVNNITDTVRFNQLVSELMDGLVRNVISNGGSKDRFAFGESNFTVFQTIYGNVQCTPDISISDCNRCLRGAMNETPSCCFEFQGGRILRPSCQIRYEVFPFYDLEQVTALAPAPAPFPVSLPPPSRTNTTTMPSPPPNSSKTDGKGRKSRRTVVIIAISASVAALIFLSVLTICFCTRKRRSKEKIGSKDVDEIETVESLQFDFVTIRTATDNFSDVNKVGGGGFGVVYKGRLPDGQEIAVKRFSSNSGQGVQEFKNEVSLVAKLEHRNLVRLLGFCCNEEEKLLIYQFMPNASLDRFIFDPVKRAQLTWEKRYMIIGGIARGLLYLHEDSRLKIIHRDLKASNVLLDDLMNPKITDFGIARLFLVDQSQGSTNTIVGTYGYMSPEYAMHGQFSVKSDVYSFGVLVLEIVSGRKNNGSYEPNHAEDLLSHAWRLWKEKTALEFIDPTIRDCFSQNEVMTCIHIGLLCVQDDVDARPTMASVGFMLNSYSSTLPLPSTPAVTMGFSTSSSIPSSANGLSITELYPR